MEKENDLTNLGTVEELIGANGKIIELTDFDNRVDTKVYHIPLYFRHRLNFEQ
jgi:hypothetical protein